MLVIEKTATTTLAKTVFLEYRNAIIENLGENAVQIMTSYLDLRAKMIDEGAVMDTVAPYGQNVYESLKPRKKKAWFGLITKEVHELGFIHFKTESGSSDIRITAFNGHVAKVSRALTGGAEIKQHWYDRNAVSKADYYAGLLSPHTWVVRVTYTCPSDKIAMVEVLQAMIYRVTSPDVVNSIYCWWDFTPTGASAEYILFAFIRSNVMYERDSRAIGTTMTMFEGDRIRGNTQDLCIAGTIFYHLSYKLTEFDA